MQMRAAILLVISSLGSGWAQAQSETTVFEGARLIVGDGTVVEDAVLVVEDGKIESVGRKDEIAAPRGATRVSLESKTLMPLLIDVHGHVGFLKDGVFAAESYGAENIIEQLHILEYYGVGAFLSLGTDLGPDAWTVREDQRAGKIGGARLFVAGRGFVAPGGGPTIAPLAHVPHEVDHPELARLLVRDNAARGCDMIRVPPERGARPVASRDRGRCVRRRASVCG